MTLERGAVTADIAWRDERVSSLPPRLPPPDIDPDRLEVESLKVVARLRRKGYVAYLVGGCVRDLLVGARPKDYDVATSAHPEEIRALFRHSRLIGRRFRLAHVYFPGGRLVEVATFRATPVQATDEEGEPTGDLLVTDDNHFGTAEEDARRRDFTINALFYDVVPGKVLDYVGGLEDLAAKVVRTIGDPEIRLREDPVRGLRAARIAAKLGFRLGDETFQAMLRHSRELPRCAPARVLEETLKLLRSGASREAFRILREARILPVLLAPVAQTLEKGGAAAQERFFSRLGALDAEVGAGKPVTDAVMLATLLAFLPLHHDPRAAPEGAGFDEVEGAAAHSLPSADKVLGQMSQAARLPRRIAERARMILAIQRLLQQGPRRRTGGFVRTPQFPEALQLLEIEARASGQHTDLVARWRERVAEMAKAVSRGEGALAARARGGGAEPARGSERTPESSAIDEQPDGSGAGTQDGSSSALGSATGRPRRRRGGRRRRKPGLPRPPSPDGAPDGA